MSLRGRFALNTCDYRGLIDLITVECNGSVDRVLLAVALRLELRKASSCIAIVDYSSIVG